jgi:hypothetical protein
MKKEDGFCLGHLLLEGTEETSLKFLVTQFSRQFKVAQTWTSRSDWSNMCYTI